MEFPDPRNPVHAYAREQKLLMAQLVTTLVTELGCAEPTALAEQLVTLADGAASRAVVLDQADYGQYAWVAAEILLERALTDRDALNDPGRAPGAGTRPRGGDAPPGRGRAPGAGTRPRGGVSLRTRRSPARRRRLVRIAAAPYVPPQ
ncbi:hypothetical protein [Streptomyces sp. NPDC017941]|uniref:hypothetical protein n=1 Tax=Streptomyces sp. NPDC017941 TaxID=3365018 RepID=UPI00379C5176